MKKAGTGGKGHTSKHVGSSKHHAHTSKHHPKHPVKTHQHAGHHVHVKGKHPHHGRGLAVGDLLPVCSLEAVAMSLRLAGQPVPDDEVAWLWELCGSRELSIGEALAAAARFGLAGVRPAAASLPPPRLRREGGGWWNRTTWSAGEGLWRHLDAPADLNGSHDALANLPLILGVDVPGPHAVLATPDGWWSWGELWTPWTTAVSEAWVIAWQ